MVIFFTDFIHVICSFQVHESFFISFAYSYVFLANARVVKVFLPFFGEKSIWAPGQEGHMILLSATLPLWRPAKEAHSQTLVLLLPLWTLVCTISIRVYTSVICTFIPLKTPQGMCAYLYPAGHTRYGKGRDSLSPRRGCYPGFRINSLFFFMRGRKIFLHFTAV